MDGMRYLISPSDLPTCCTWIPTAELEINLAKGFIRNMECDVLVKLL